jgi:hypothetical protein
MLRQLRPERTGRRCRWRTRRRASAGKGDCYGSRCGRWAAFAEADIVGACDKLDDPAAPVWSKVHLTNAEALGCGTIAYDDQAGRIVPHVHTTLGLKERSAAGYTSHLLAARVQFLVEVVIVEVTAPSMTRPPDPSLYDVPRLVFGGR